MSHRRAVLVLLAAAAVVSSAPARAASVWTALASEKIRPETPARTDAQGASIAAARNEFESFQIVVTGPATGVTALASDLKGAGTIGGVKLFRAGLLNVTQASAADGALGRIPDPLVPDVDDVVGEKRNAFPFDVPAGESRAIWVEVYIPQDAAAGAYEGAVVVRSSAGEQSVPVRLTVWDFALPSTASLKTSFALTPGVRNRHFVVDDELSRLRARYGQLALDHRISLHSVWADGNRDWNHIDQFYGPLFDGTAPTRLPGAKMTSIMSGAKLDSVQEHQEWAAHFKARGWFDRLFQYTCDEPPLTCQWSDIQTRAGAAHQADPAFRTLVTTDVDEVGQHGGDGLLSAIDLMTPLVNYLDDRPNSLGGWRGATGPARSEYDAFLGKSQQKELWLYQSCMSHGCGGTVDIGNPSADQLYFTGWPSYMVDASSVRARAMEWLSFRYDATGELYYETIQAYYTQDPWNGIWEFSGNGDGTLFYPGTPNVIGGQTEIPVSSIRLKMIREGMEDYEYLKMLSDLGGREAAKNVAEKLFPHAYQTDAKPEDLMGAREALAREILALKGKAVPPPGLTVATTNVNGFGNVPAMAATMGAGGCGASSTHRTGAGLVGALLAPLILVLRGLYRRRRRT